MHKVLVIDNYDSFTYNLVHLVEEILGHDITVWRNDQIDYNTIDNFEYIILSPGPGIPEEAGDLKKVIAQHLDGKKVLGVCLGHQALGEVYGATLQNLDRVYHGVSTEMKATEPCILLENMSSSFEAGRYHSWVIQSDTLSDEFIVTSIDDNGQIMSMRHKNKPIYGVQFHPESVLTPAGKIILTNFLSL